MFSQMLFRLLFGFFCRLFNFCFFLIVPGNIRLVISYRSILPVPQDVQDLIGIDGYFLFEVFRLVKVPLVGSLHPFDQRFIGMMTRQQAGHRRQYRHQGGGQRDVKRPFLFLLFSFLLNFLVQMFCRYFDFFH